MGQAKKRGSFEERKAAAKPKQKKSKKFSGGDPEIYFLSGMVMNLVASHLASRRDTSSADLDYIRDPSIVPVIGR